MKTNQLKFLGLALILLSAGRIHALELFECVRDLLPITPQADFQVRRKAFEKPYMASANFMVIPEIRDTHVTGFFIYASNHASYYDVTSLREDGQYRLVAQPMGLETVTVTYTPSLGRTQFARRTPAAMNLESPRQLTKLTAQTSRPKDELWQPLREEIALRKQWVQTHNMSEEPFRILARIMDTTCKP